MQKPKHGVGSGLVLILVVLMAAGCIRQPSGPPIKIGLIAPLSGSVAASGEAIQRGILLAMDEINSQGGVLGRPLELVVRDVKNDPPAGVTALREMAAQDQIVAVFGGIYSPVMLGQLDALHELRIPLVNAWGSVTGITRNGRSPNYAFRVSVSDAQADEFLVRYTLQISGAKRPGIIADTSAWGDSNVAGLTAWLKQLGVELAGTERFAQGDTNMIGQLERLRAAGADALLMIANTAEGAAIARGRASLGWKAPVISHWGITGGRFAELAGVENAEGILTLQTFSFYGDLSPRAAALLPAYHKRFGTQQIDEVLAPVGVAHGYDGMHLLARAIAEAGTTEGPKLRDALEHLKPYDGLLKRYDPAFTPDNHDALLAADYRMTVWQAGKLVPAPQSRLEGK